MLRISLQRFAQFATGRIRRGGHDSGIFDLKIGFSQGIGAMCRWARIASP
jgi:hypothetical protein